MANLDDEEQGFELTRDLKTIMKYNPEKDGKSIANNVIPQNCALCGKSLTNSLLKNGKAGKIT